jgi:hypothetical protein
MSDYQFVLKLEASDQSSPQVRVWVDDQLAGDLSSEQEIKLERTADGVWSAHFSARDVFMYRVGIYAAPGSQWSLSFFSGGDDARELLFDSDELTAAKEWLVGTCEHSDPVRLRRVGLAEISSGALS